MAVSPRGDGSVDVFICNNYGHTVTRHVIDTAAGLTVRTAEVLLRKRLDIPDGIAVSPDRRWIALSNHSTHDVLVYDNGSALDESTDPVGILRGVHYPHGLRFTRDARHLLVADAGSPYLQVYATGEDGWHGVRHPTASVRVMDDAVFEIGRYRNDEGGPKGLDVDREMRVAVTTSQHQPLAFFDLRALLAGVEEAVNGSRRRQQQLDVAYELHYLEDARTARAKAEQADHMSASRSWRITAPLRRVFDAIGRIRRGPS